MTSATPGTFGAHVQRLRRAQGLTQEKLAERSTLHPDTIRGLERNTFKPSLRTLCKLAKGLGLSLSELFAGFDERSASS